MQESTAVITGERICGSEYLRGYNTFSHNQEIVSATCGVVEVVEKVVSVRGLCPRYVPEVGDVVVGRVVEVSGNRWRIDIGAHQDAVMLLSNVTEPGGMLRRRGREDELTMRNLFAEDDVVVAEVQRILPDGIVSLHTRVANKYGKLTHGQLVEARPTLIRRSKRQFHPFEELGIEVIFGVNGRLWLRKLQSDVVGDGEEPGGEEPSPTHAAEISDPASEEASLRERLARLRNCVLVLNDGNASIHPDSVYSAYHYTIEDLGVRAEEVLRSENRARIILGASGGVGGSRKRARE